MHDPGDQAVFGHLVDADPAAALRQGFDALFRVKRTSLDDVRQVFVAFDDDPAHDFRVEDPFLIGSPDDLGIGLEKSAQLHHARHPGEYQSSRAPAGVTEPLGIPHPFEEDQRVGLEVAHRRFPFAARVFDPTQFVLLPRPEERDEYFGGDLCPVGGDDHQRVHLRRIQKRRIVAGQQIIHRITDLLAQWFRKDMFGDASPKHRRQHLRFVADLRTGKIPVVIGKIVAVAGLVEADRRPEIAFERLDVTEDRLAGAGEVEIFFQIGFAHLRRHGSAIRIAVLLEPGNQPDQSLQLFFPHRHRKSPRTFFRSPPNIIPESGHFVSKEEKIPKIFLPLH